MHIWAWAYLVLLALLALASVISEGGYIGKYRFVLTMPSRVLAGICLACVALSLFTLSGGLVMLGMIAAALLVLYGVPFVGLLIGKPESHGHGQAVLWLLVMSLGLPLGWMVMNEAAIQFETSQGLSGDSSASDAVGSVDASSGNEEPSGAPIMDLPEGLKRP